MGGGVRAGGGNTPEGAAAHGAPTRGHCWENETHRSKEQSEDTFEYHHGWGLHNISGQPVLVLDHLKMSAFSRLGGVPCGFNLCLSSRLWEQLRRARLPLLHSLPSGICRAPHIPLLNTTRFRSAWWPSLPVVPLLGRTTPQWVSAAPAPSSLTKVFNRTGPSTRSRGWPPVGLRATHHHTLARPFGRLSAHLAGHGSTCPLFCEDVWADSAKSLAELEASSAHQAGPLTVGGHLAGEARGPLWQSMLTALRQHLLRHALGSGFQVFILVLLESGRALGSLPVLKELSPSTASIQSPSGSSALSTANSSSWVPRRTQASRGGTHACSRASVSSAVPPVRSALRPIYLAGHHARPVLHPVFWVPSP